MVTIERKNSSRLIVPHCLDLQALCRDGVLFCCSFLTMTCGFLPENMSAGRRGSGHKFCGCACPSPGPSLALGVGPVTIHLCPCLHVVFICLLLERHQSTFYFSSKLVPIPEHGYLWMLPELFLIFFFITVIILLLFLMLVLFVMLHVKPHSIPISSNIM